MQKTKKYLQYKFTEDEIKQFAKNLAYECRQAEQLEEQKKEVMSDLKAKIDSKSATVSKLSNNINNGYEYRDIECEVKMNAPDDGKKSVVRLDTQEVVEIEPMTPKEMQEELPLDK